jgi:PTS system cellobiose-specific IIB component
MLKMRKIMLFCAAGMSTSLLVSKMQKEAEARGINDLKIWAVSVSEYEREIGNVDVCLLGPQVRFRLAQAKELGLKLGVPVDVISMMDYGSCNGPKVLDQALNMMATKEAK